MRSWLKNLAWLAGLALAACGGGGGDSGALDFTPSKLEGTQFFGAGRRLAVEAVPTRTFTGPVYVQLVDGEGVTLPPPNLYDMGDSSFIGVIRMRPDLAIGTHSGSFTVRLCKDIDCVEQHPGSPVRLPYRVTVREHDSNLTALQPLEGAPEWSTFRGTNAHAGYVPVTLDAREFSPRWLWTDGIAEGFGISGTPVTADGTLFFSTSGPTGSQVVARKEDAMQPVWTYDLGYVHTLNPAAVADGRVYAATSGHGDTAMHGFDASDGTPLFSTPFAAQWERYLHPIVEGGKVYTNGGYYGGMYCFDGVTGAQDWFVQLNQYDYWTPTAAGGMLFSPIGISTQYSYGPYRTGQTRVTPAGAVAGFTDDNRTANEQAMMDAGGPLFFAHGPLAAGAGKLVSSNGVSLTAFHDTGGIAWQKVGAYTTNPAVTEDTVFAIKERTLEARDLVNGTLLWSWTAPSAPVPYGMLYEDPLVTNNLVFLSTDRAVVAIDRATHQQVWSYPMPGRLAVSPSGLLYVLLMEVDGYPNGALAAINLQ